VPCTAPFQAAWTKASRGKPVSLLYGFLGRLTASSFTIVGRCHGGKTFSFSGGRLRLLTGALVSQDAAGTVSNKKVCVTSATFSSPALWRLGQSTVSDAHPLCERLDNSAPPTGQLVASGVPFLGLPGRVSNRSTTLTLTKKDVTLAFTGDVAGAGPASVSATLARTGDFQGTASLSGVHLFGHPVDFSGAVSGDRTGIKSSSVSATIAGPIKAASGFSLSNTTLTLGSDGISVSSDGAVGIGAQSVPVHVAGSFSHLNTWSLSVSTPSLHTWTPVSGLTISPALSGALTDTAGKITFDVSAQGANSGPLVDWSPRNNVDLTLNSVEISNGDVPSSCLASVDSGHVWLQIAGTAQLTPLPQTPLDLTAGGCADLTARTFGFSLSDSGGKLDLLSSGGNSLTVSDLTFTLSGGTSAGLQTISGTGSLAGLIAGKSISGAGILALTSDGTLVAGGQENLQSWLGINTTGTLYYASAALTGFDTGNSQLGKIDLPKGISLAFTFALDSTTEGKVNQELADLGLPQLAGSSLAAQATFDPSADSFSIRVGLNLPSNLGPVFSRCSDGSSSCAAADATSLTLSSVYLTFSDTAGALSFGLGGSGSLHLPPMTSGGQDSTLGVQVDASFDLSTFTVTLSLATTGDMPDAFGISGLTLSNVGVQGSLSFATGIPVPGLGFTATVTQLPSTWANDIGFTQGSGTLLKLGLNISDTNPIVDIEIGDPNSTTTVLRPLTALANHLGQPGVADYVDIDHASLIIAPHGGTIAGTTYDPGVDFAFLGTILGVQVNASGAFSSTGLSVDGQVASFTLPKTSVKLGQTTLHLAIGSSGVALSASGSFKTSGFTLTGQPFISLDTHTGAFSVNASLQSGAPHVIASAVLSGTFAPASGAISLSGQGFLIFPAPLGSVTGQFTIDPGSGVSATFDIGSPLGTLQFTGAINAAGFSLSAGFDTNVSGSDLIVDPSSDAGTLGWAVSGSFSLHVGGTLSTLSGLIVDTSGSLSGSTHVCGIGTCSGDPTSWPGVSFGPWDVSNSLVVNADGTVTATADFPAPIGTQTITL
jgi:hypothetical protein